MPAITTQTLQFRTDDGANLTGTIFAPETPARVVVLAGATGVPEGFYRRFATWLAQDQGMACLTFTYRDMEDPSPRNMRRSQVTMSQWAIEDGQAARDAARAAFPDLEVWIITHSLGGMCLSKQPRLDGITRVITVASGLVDHTQHPMPYRFMVFLFWFVIGPLATRVMGYLPGKTIGLGSTLPAPVYWQWRKWCTSGPKGVLEDTDLPASDWARSGAPVKIVAVTDDEICPPVCAFNLAEAFEGAKVTELPIDPADKGVKRLGHFGLFTKAGQPWWDDLIA